MKKVSVCITTYNHEAFIGQALEGVLKQKTAFDFEILLGEDDSPDNTREICRRYAKKYPGKIRLFLNDRKNVMYIDGNATGRWNFINLVKHAKGEYFARCDGDDYWTDENKLQKMVDFMEAHPEYALCFHRVQWLKNGQLTDEPYPPPAGKTYYTADDLFLYDNFIRTSAVLYRNVLQGKLPDWFKFISFGDIGLHLLHSQHGNIGYLDEVMGVYRVHEKGIFSSEKPYINIYKSIKTFAIAAEHLGYTGKASFKLGQARMLDALAQIAKREAGRLQAEAQQEMSAAQPAAIPAPAVRPQPLKQQPLVSVIVPTYNRPDGLRQALESIAAQTYQNIEALVVNDAGEDVSAVIEEFKSRLTINYLVHKQNKDLAGARNTGLKHAAGDYVAYLDDDDVFFPNHIEEALRILTNSGYEVVYSDAFRFHQEEENGVYVTKHMDIPYSVDFDAERILKGNIAPVLTYVHARSCVDKAGYFDESLHTHEDWDFFIRLSRHYPFYHNKKITCAFSWRYDASKMTGSRREDFVRTTEIIYGKYAQYVQHKPQIKEFQKRHLSNLKAAVKEQMKQGGKMKKDFHGPLVSIVIPLFNQLEYTQKCLAALFRHTVYAPYQVILVDNGSTDGTAEFVRQLAGSYKMIKSIRNESNLGFAKACNQGARAADGQYIVFLNNDTEVQKYWLVRLVQTAYNDARIGAVGAKLLYADGSIQHAGVIVTRDERSGLALSPQHIYYGQKGDMAEANVPYIYQALTAACLLVPRDDFFAAGGFDEAYLNGYEDVDLCFKLGQRGKLLVYQPQSVVVHHESKSGPQRFAAMDKNREILYRKWLPLIQVDNIVRKDGKIEYSKPAKIGPYRDFAPVIRQTEKSSKPRISFLALERHEVACPVLRLAAPLRQLQQQKRIDYLPFDLVSLKMNWVPVEQLRENDILIIQRNFVAEMPYAKLKKGFGDKLPKIVYEFDDAFDRLPPHHPGYAYYKNMQANFEEYLRHADLVTVASQVQKDYYSHLNKNIIVLPNTVIEEIWRQDKKPRKRGKKRVSILFSGTNGHLQDFRLIESVLERILREHKDDVELLFWADIPTELEQLPNFKRIADFMANYYDYAEMLQSIDADLALVPLEYNDFNRAKTHIKWLEYSACAIPGIYSDIPAYREAVRDYKTGILVNEDPRSWYKAITFMIDHPKERRKIARTAYKEVWAKHTLSQNLHYWQEAYERLLEPSRETQKSYKFSVVILTWNRAQLLDLTLRALSENLYFRDQTEILIGDNGSTDDTAQVIKKYSGAKYIRNDRNIGLELYKELFRQAKGEYIIILDDDVLDLPFAFDKTFLDYFETFPEYGFLGLDVFKNTYTNGAKPDDSAFTEEERDGKIIQRGDVGGWCACVPKNVFAGLSGFFNEHLSMANTEDSILNIHIRAAGRKTGILKNVRCFHATGAYYSNRFHLLERDMEKYRLAGMQHFANRYRNFSYKRVQPLVSIIIPVFNKLDLTRGCVRSILQNTQYPNYEILFIDNGSSDATRAYLENIVKEEKRIRCIFNQRNAGFAIANNQGAEEAGGEYILFLNNDTEVQPGWLCALVDVAEDNPAVGAVGSKLLYPDGTLQHAGVVLVEDRQHGDPLLATHNFYKEAGDKPEANRLKTYQALSAACLLLRKELFAKLGGFDPGYWNGYEDVDLCFRIAREGYKLVYQPESVVLHYESQSGEERWKKVNQNIKRLHQKWLGTIQPDLIVDKDGQSHITEQSGIRPYHMLQNVLSRKAQEEIMVSIIMLTYNALDFTRQAVESVLQHTQYPFELILVDNGSAEDTRRYLQKIEEEYANVHTIFNKENKGFAAGNNQGAQMAFGKYLMFLNNDVLVSDGWLKSLVEGLEKDEHIGMVGPITNRISGRQMVTDVPYTDVAGFPQFAAQVRRINHGKLTPRRRLAGFAILMPKALFEQVGGFDESFGSGNYEDDDLCLRVRQAGYALMADESTYIHHFGSQTFKANNIDYSGSLEEKGARFKEKWPEVDYEELLEIKNPLPEYINNSMAEAARALQKGDMVTAKDIYESLTVLNPLQAEPLFGAALACNQLSEADRALQYLERLNRLQPEDAQVYNQIGTAYMIKEDFEAAQAAFVHAIELDPAFVDAQRNYAGLLIETGQYEDGIRAFQQIVINHPDDVAALLNLAKLNIEADRLYDARLYLNKAKQTEADNPLLQELEHIVQERTAEDMPPEVTEALNKAATLIDNGDLQEAEREYRSVLEDAPENPTALFGLAVVYRQLQKDDQARALLEELTRVQPEFTEAYNHLGQMALMRKEYALAQSYFIKSLEIDPGQIHTRNFLSDVLLAEGEYENGVNLLIHNLKEAPDDVETLLRVGIVHYDAGKTNESKQFFSRALELQPDNDIAKQYLEI